MQEPSVLLVETNYSGSCLIITNFNSQSSYVIWFDTFSGHPLFFGIPGYDIFANELTALEFIRTYNSKNSSNSNIRSQRRAKYLIGIHKITYDVLLITVVKSAKKMGQILGKHDVFTIQDVEYWTLPLQNDISFDPQTTEQMIFNFKRFPIKEIHFFSPTFDLTSAFGLPEDESMIWNLTLSKPFKKFNISCCVTLIQGFIQFLTLGNNPNIIIYAIMRRRCTGSGPIHLTEGLNQDGNVGNESELEFVAETNRHGFFETFSQVFRRCSSPISPPSLHSSSTEATLMQIPYFLHRMVEQYSIKNISLVDLSNEYDYPSYDIDPSIKNNDSIISILSNILPFLSNAFNIHLYQYRWNNQKKYLNQNLDAVLSILIPIIDNIDVYHFVWNDLQINPSRDCKLNKIKPKCIQKQNGLIILSCKNGLDNNSFSSFIAGLYSFALIFNKMNLIETTPKNFTQLKTLFINFNNSPNTTVDYNLNSSMFLTFMAKFIIITGRAISKIYSGSSFYQEDDLIALSKLSIKPIPRDIMKENRRNFINFDQFKNVIKQFKNESEMSLSFCERDCVSIVPGAHVLFPKTLNDKIFSLCPTSCYINVNEPIVISLSRPVLITQIVFSCKLSNLNLNSTFSSNSIPYNGKNWYRYMMPSTVSIYGGMYLNRLVPIFENISLLHSDNIDFIRITDNFNDINYGTEINFPELEQVRFVQIKFDSYSQSVARKIHIKLDKSGPAPFQKVLISNIFIYGKCKLPSPLPEPLPNFVPPPQIKDPDFSGDTSVNSIIKWEEQRIRANYSFNKFAIKMIEKQLNPYFNTISYYMKLKRSLFLQSDSVLCSKCKARPATFLCGMCEKKFCSICTKINEINEMVSNKIEKTNVCNNCASTRTRISKQIPRFDQIYVQQINKEFPFLGNYQQIYVYYPFSTSKKKKEEYKLTFSKSFNASMNYYSMNNLLNSCNNIWYENYGKIIGAIFVSEPPIGENGIHAENILNYNNYTNNPDWKPEETCVLLSVLLKQKSRIQSIHIKCSEPLTMIIKDKEFNFFPPFTECKVLQKQNDTLDLLDFDITLIGNPRICISNIEFIGIALPTEVLDESQDPKNEAVDNVKMKNERINGIFADALFSSEKNSIRFKFNYQKLIYGLYFEELYGNQTFIMEYINDQDKRVINHIKLPKGYFKKFAIELPKYDMMKEFNLWFANRYQDMQSRITPLEYIPSSIM